MGSQAIEFIYILFGGTFALLAILVFGVMAFVINQRRVLQSEREKVKALEEKETHLRNLTRRLESIREEERRWIAKEIHDELGSVLTGLKFELEWLKGNVKRSRSLYRRCNAMQEQIDTTIKKVQHIASELRPALLDTLGLSAAVEWYVREFYMRTHIDVKLQKCEEIKFPDMTKPTMLFRILQEALTNVARHSGATRVEVELRRNNGMIELRVQDNGRGITKEEQVRSTSVGVLGMIERAHTIGGSMSITGGKGTEVRVVVPMEQASTQRMETE